MFESDDKIVLDRITFKALAADTRINILKSLSNRRKTLSELSKELSMSVSTIKEHLEILVNCGLIKVKDEGYKWKYYNLTEKGLSVLNPARKKLWIVLVCSLFSMVGVGVSLFQNLFIKKDEVVMDVMVQSSSVVESDSFDAVSTMRTFDDMVGNDLKMSFFDKFFLFLDKLPLVETITFIFIVLSIVFLILYIKK
jgi:DNA-binding transcriptional ArsR family regulator